MSHKILSIILHENGLSTVSAWLIAPGSRLVRFGRTLEWDIHAHQHAAGPHTKSPEAEALGRSQGGCNTKVHLRAEGGGKLMTLALTPGQRHEAVAFEALMAGGAVKRAWSGRPKHRPR